MQLCWINGDLYLSKMRCGDNEQCSKSKVQKEKYRRGAEQTGTSKKIIVGSDAIEK